MLWELDPDGCWWLLANPVDGGVEARRTAKQGAGIEPGPRAESANTGEINMSLTFDELRRVGEMVFVRDGRKPDLADVAAYREALLADPGIPRLLALTKKPLSISEDVMSLRDDILTQINGAYGYYFTELADAILAIPELKQALEDAERYRYWRKHHGWSGYFNDGTYNSKEPNDIDAAIDKARRK